MTDGSGDATIKLLLVRLETGDEVWSQEVPYHFPDRLIEVTLLFRSLQWSLPVAGWYQLMLLVDGELVTQRKIFVQDKESEP